MDLGKNLGVFYLWYSRLFGNQHDWSYTITDFLILCACFVLALQEGQGCHFQHFSALQDLTRNHSIPALAFGMGSAAVMKYFRENVFLVV